MRSTTGASGCTLQDGRVEGWKLFAHPKTGKVSEFAHRRHARRNGYKIELKRVSDPSCSECRGKGVVWILPDFCRPEYGPCECTKRCVEVAEEPMD